MDLRFPDYENTEIVEGVPSGWRKGILDNIVIESGKREKKKTEINTDIICLLIICQSNLYLIPKLMMFY